MVGPESSKDAWRRDVGALSQFEKHFNTAVTAVTGASLRVGHRTRLPASVLS